MKALTLWQPWASLCVIPRPDRVLLTPTGRMQGDLYEYDGAPVPFKTIETRSWPAPKSLIGQRIAIHAAKTVTGLEQCYADPDAQPIRDALRPNFATWGDIPLGVVVGTAVLADCLPMADLDESRRMIADRVPHLWVDHQDDRLMIWQPDRQGGVDDRIWRSVTDQLPFGLFEPGRWAWLLTDAERFDEPIPATGRQGLWNWDGAA